MAYDPKEHMIQIKSGQVSKDYLPVQQRVVWFRDSFPQGTIETEMLLLDLDRETEEEAFVWNAEKRRSEKVLKQARGFAVFRAVVKDGLGGVATGTKSEKAASFGDFIEKAETGAIGRALAALGYGTQFVGDEWDEGHRIVDSPVEQQKKHEEPPTEAALVKMVVADLGKKTKEGLPLNTEQVKRLLFKRELTAGTIDSNTFFKRDMSLEERQLAYTRIQQELSKQQQAS